MKFLVDLPLGGLAKWLRLCGFDAENRRLGAELPPASPEVCVLTRQESLERLNRTDLLFIKAAEPESQLREVLAHLKISPHQIKPLSRCSRCNERLIPVPRGQVQGRVPEHVFHYHEQFLECPGCHRVFWPGSHLSAIIKTLQKSLRD
ncbi:MAG: Mut7-C RNAse domain-containing protein [Deltaproteobacteria bacterium]|nr:Mut7-C RNAse domain-containing protein [Deltaproteobacteria bacterium]